MATDVKYEYTDETIDEELVCSICDAPFIDPISTPCRHTFCRPCINEELTTQSLCPTQDCGRALSLNDLTPAVLAVCKMVDKLLVKCQGCGKTGIKRVQFDHHIEEDCPAALVSCSAADIRCPWKGRAKLLNLHKDTCDYERMRPMFTELLTENEKLKKENQSYQTSNTSLKTELKSIQDQRTKQARKDAQSVEEINFLRDVLCHRNEALKELLSQYGLHSEIVLRKKELTDLDMGIIIRESILERQCTVLELQGNSITDQAVSLLVHALRNNTTMIKLNLNHNPISDNGVRSLANLFAMNKASVRKLHLCNIQLTDEGVHYLAEMLKTNTTLQSLGIFQNPFGDEGMQKLANVLAKHNKTLQRLYVQENTSITDASVDSFIGMFDNNRSLAAVDMEMCGLTANGRRRLREAVTRNAKVKLQI